jgi:hypothetical protein
MSMNEMYRDYLEGQMVPDITITKREDNGHFTASSMGMSVDALGSGRGRQPAH